MQFSVADPDAVKTAFKQIIDAHGRIDVLVNNAGIAKDNLLALMKPTEWDDVMNTNLKGAFLCSQAVIKPMMRQRYGRIVNVTSVVGVIGNAGQCNYSAAKAGHYRLYQVPCAGDYLQEHNSKRGRSGIHRD